MNECYFIIFYLLFIILFASVLENDAYLEISSKQVSSIKWSHWQHTVFSPFVQFSQTALSARMPSTRPLRPLIAFAGAL